MLFSMMPFAGTRAEGSSSDFSTAKDTSYFDPKDQATHAEQTAERENKGTQKELIDALRSFDEEIAPVRRIFGPMEVRPAKGKTVEQLDQDMRSEFAGILRTVESRVQDIDRIIKNIETSSTLTQETKNKVTTTLQKAQETLSEYNKKIHDNLSSNCRTAVQKAELTHWPKIISLDTGLSPEKMYDLISDKAILESSQNFLDAIQDASADPSIATQIVQLIPSFTGSIALIVKESVKKCSDPALREPLLAVRDALSRKSEEVTALLNNK